MNDIILSDRILAIEESKSIRLASAVSELRRRGEKIIGFNVGEPDFPTPKVIIDAVKQALDEGHTRYALVPGESFLREAIAKKLTQEQHLTLTAENILLSNGSKQVLYSLFQLLLNSHDEVIIPRPYWVSFPEAIKLAGGVPVYVDTQEGRLNADFILEKVTPKTKAIILNYPNNPSGLIFDAETVKEVVLFAQERAIAIISDEAYEGLLYDQDQFQGPASLADPSLKNTFIVQSFSKTFCMTGFRLGYVAASKEAIKALNKLQSHISGNTPVFIQKGALAALENQKQIQEKMRQTFQKRRDLAFSLCQKIFPQTPFPTGAFYLFPKIPAKLLQHFQDDENLCLFLLEKAKVAILPGSAFGLPGHLRLCFATSDEEIKAGFHKMAEVLEDYL